MTINPSILTLAHCWTFNFQILSALLYCTVVVNALKGNIYLKPLHPGQYLKFKPHITEKFTYQNFMHEEVQCRLNLGNNIQFRIFSISILTEKIKIKIYKTIILLVFHTGV